jgi:transcriptional regulator with XRE-family HTH domain
MKSAAREFVRLLQTAGWSQARAARALDLTPGAISQICTGKTSPRPTTLSLLRLLLRTNGEPTDPSPRPPGRFSDWEVDLLESLRRFPAGQRKKLLNAFHQMIHALSE